MKQTTFKSSLLALLISLSAGFFAQTKTQEKIPMKKESVILNNFDVDKTGKARLKFTFLKNITVSYQIQGKRDPDDWIALENGAVVGDGMPNKDGLFEEENTFELELDSMKEVRVLINYGNGEPLIKTVIIP